MKKGFKGLNLLFTLYGEILLVGKYGDEGFQGLIGSVGGSTKIGERTLKGLAGLKGENGLSGFKGKKGPLVLRGLLREVEGRWMKGFKGE